MRKVEFRDGEKLVPDHVADLMAQFETHTMTQEEAQRKVNERFLTDRLEKVQGDIVREHLTRFGSNESS